MYCPSPGSSDAPITKLADFPINQYLMADNSRYRSNMLIFIKNIKIAIIAVGWIP